MIQIENYCIEFIDTIKLYRVYEIEHSEQTCAYYDTQQEAIEGVSNKIKEDQEKINKKEVML